MKKGMDLETWSAKRRVFISEEYVLQIAEEIIGDNDAVSIRLENLNSLPDTASELTGIATSWVLSSPEIFFLKRKHPNIR